MLTMTSTSYKVMHPKVSKWTPRVLCCLTRLISESTTRSRGICFRSTLLHSQNKIGLARSVPIRMRKHEREVARTEKKGADELTREEKYLLQQLEEEIDTVRGFQNNDGRPEGSLKSLGGDALQQLESSLSVEDQ